MIDTKKEKLLRDSLAIDRTNLANQRTLLSFIRTSIMLLATGVTIMKLLPIINPLFYTGIIAIVASVVFITIGSFSYKRVKKDISKAYIEKK
jgi:putative membrane protein